MRASLSPLFASAIIFLFCALPLLAQDSLADPPPEDLGQNLGFAPAKAYRGPSDLIVRITLQVITNSDEEHQLESSPSPIIYMMGLGSTFPLNSAFAFDPSLDVYSWNYGYLDGRALPFPEEDRTALVLGALLDLSFSYKIRLAEKHALKLCLGPALNLRLAVLARDVSDDESVQDVADINSYFYDKARFLYPAAGLSYSWQMASWVRFGLGARVLVPIFHFWDGEEIAFSDNMIIGGGVYLSFIDFWENASATLAQRVAKPKTKAKAQEAQE